jgi:predicted glycosyltransferase
MNVLFYLGHPAHFHMLKNVIRGLDAQGVRTQVLIKKKDILEELVSSAPFPYINILSRGRSRRGGASMAVELLEREVKMLAHCLRRRPDLLVGTSAEITHVGRLIGRPSAVINEDDADVVPLFARAAYPFATAIISPRVCSVGKWAHKKASYEGYQKLAYLHPNRFTPSRDKVEHLFSGRQRYFLIRLVKLNAHHDAGVRGLNLEYVQKLIGLLLGYGKVHISCEGDLAPELEAFRLTLPPQDIHHALGFASLLVGDSQSMTVEAAVLGTPAIRFNDFAGRISVLEELEHKYGLAIGIPAGEPNRLYAAVEALLNRSDLVTTWKKRREQMLADKIDVAAFWTWLFCDFSVNWPALKRDPTLSGRFRYSFQPRLDSPL